MPKSRKAALSRALSRRLHLPLPLARKRVKKGISEPRYGRRRTPIEGKALLSVRTRQMVGLSHGEEVTHHLRHLYLRLPSTLRRSTEMLA